MKAQLEKDIEKYSNFRSKVLGLTKEERTVQSHLNLRGYMKHILEKGSTDEKRELMHSFSTPLILKDKRVVVEWQNYKCLKVS